MHRKRIPLNQKKDTQICTHLGILDSDGCKLGCIDGVDEGRLDKVGTVLSLGCDEGCDDSDGTRLRLGCIDNVGLDVAAAAEVLPLSNTNPESVPSESNGIVLCFM